MKPVREALGVLAILSLTVPARAGGPLGDNGGSISTSRYTVDLYQGPVLSGTRVTGLAGAYVAIAEDVDGNLQNPATPANRPFFSVGYFDWWVGLGATFPSTLRKLDFYNSGEATDIQGGASGLVFLTPAMNLQWGPWGVGVTFGISTFGVGGAEENEAELGALIVDNRVQLARAFFDGQFVAGIGLRSLVMNLNENSTGSDLFSSVGSGLELGLLVRPTGMPFRIGASFKSPIDTRAEFSKDRLPNDDGDVIATDSAGNELYMPLGVSQPWEVNVGAAVQLGRRPLNLGWVKPNYEEQRAELKYQSEMLELERALEEELEEIQSAGERKIVRQQHRARKRLLKMRLEREKKRVLWDEQRKLATMPRFHVLITSSLVVSGAARQAVGIESFLHQIVRRSGERVVYSPRIGIETEIVPDWVKVRGGSYLEPGRMFESTPRVHGTAGLDLRLVRWSVFGIGPDDYLWRLALSADASERYFSWGIMIGGWYPRHAQSIPDRFTQGSDGALVHPSPSEAQ